MEIILVTLGGIIILLGSIIYNLITKTEKLEKIVDSQNVYIDNISNLIEISNRKISESDIASAFKADDQVGFFFEMIREIQNQLNYFKTK